MTPISIKTFIKHSLNPTYYSTQFASFYPNKKILSTPFVLRMCVSHPKLIPLFGPWIPPRWPFPAPNGPFPSQPLLLRTPTTPSPLTKFPSTNYHSHYITSITTKYHHLFITSIYQSLLYIYSPYLLCHYYISNLTLH